MEDGIVAGVVTSDADTSYVNGVVYMFTPSVVASSKGALAIPEKDRFIARVMGKMAEVSSNITVQARASARNESEHIA